MSSLPTGADAPALLTDLATTKRPLRIGVIVGLDLVGDALIKLPFARALRAAWPDAEIHWITSKGPSAYAGPLRPVTQDLIDYVDDRPAWLPQTAPEAPVPAVAPLFDLLIDTRGRMRDALALRRHMAPHLLITPALHFFLSSRRPPLFTPRPRHLVDRLLQMLALAAGYIPPTNGRLDVGADRLAMATRLLPPGPVYVGFAPGAGNPVKIWPLDRFIRVAQDQQAKGRVPVFILGPAEMDMIPVIKAALPDALCPLQNDAAWGGGPLGIEHTMALACQLNVAIANDSGTGHMLAAVDCPLISLFGPTDSAKLAPRTARGLVIRAQDFGGESMAAIPHESVIETLDREIMFQISNKK